MCRFGLGICGFYEKFLNSRFVKHSISYQATEFHCACMITDLMKLAFKVELLVGELLVGVFDETLRQGPSPLVIAKCQDFSRYFQGLSI